MSYRCRPARTKMRRSLPGPPPEFEKFVPSRLFVLQFFFCDVAERFRATLSSPKVSHQEKTWQTDDNGKRKNGYQKGDQSENEIQRKIEARAERPRQPIEKSGRAGRKDGRRLQPDLYGRETGLIFEETLSPFDLFDLAANLG